MTDNELMAQKNEILDTLSVDYDNSTGNRTTSGAECIRKCREALTRLTALRQTWKNHRYSYKGGEIIERRIVNLLNEVKEDRYYCGVRQHLVQTVLEAAWQLSKIYHDDQSELMAH